MNFLIADMIWFVSGTIITFSQGGTAKIKSKQFSEFGSWTISAVQFCSFSSVHQNDIEIRVLPGR